MSQPTITRRGQEFLAQTDPLLLETLLVRDDTQVWARMQGKAFLSWVKPGEVTPVQVPIWIQGGTPDTTIQVWYRQRWDRGWGGETPPALENVACGREMSQMRT